MSYIATYEEQQKTLLKANSASLATRKFSQFRGIVVTILYLAAIVEIIIAAYQVTHELTPFWLYIIIIGILSFSYFLVHLRIAKDSTNSSEKTLSKANNNDASIKI